MDREVRLRQQHGARDALRFELELGLIARVSCGKKCSEHGLVKILRYYET